MAINDIVEMTSDWTTERVDTVDIALKQIGLPTLTEVRGRFSKLVQRAVRRGSIRDEVEYYAVRNAAEFGEAEQLWQLLSAYENAVKG